MSDNTSTLVIQIDKQLHREIKAICALDGTTIKSYIQKLVTENIQERKKDRNLG